MVIGLNRDREVLYQKINRRVDAMFAKGLVREVKRLARKKLSKTALQGVGYKELVDHLGLTPGVETRFRLPVSKRVKERIKQTTRHFAKRQWTWFKRERGIRWVWWPETASLADVRDFIVGVIKK